MFGLDEYIAQFSRQGSVWLFMGAAVLLGLRHATDPDHLMAVSALAAGEEGESAKKAGIMGLFWGLGHGTTLVLLGLPIILFKFYLPETLQKSAELAVGLLIVFLGVRLLEKWRNGSYHAHSHEHGKGEHKHLHSHTESNEHGHVHPTAPGRTNWQAFGIGALHGIGGTAGVGVLLLATISNVAYGVAALVLFAAFSAVSMALVTGGFGWLLSTDRNRQGLTRFAPVLGVVSVLFGVWYMLGAVEAVPYIF